MQCWWRLQDEASNTITLPACRAHHSLGRASPARSAGSRCPEAESSREGVMKDPSPHGLGSCEVPVSATGTPVPLGAAGGGRGGGLPSGAWRVAEARTAGLRPRGQRSRAVGSRGGGSRGDGQQPPGTAQGDSRPFVTMTTGPGSWGGAPVWSARPASPSPLGSGLHVAATEGFRREEPVPQPRPPAWRGAYLACTAARPRPAGRSPRPKG